MVMKMKSYLVLSLALLRLGFEGASGFGPVLPSFRLSPSSGLGADKTDGDLLDMEYDEEDFDAYARDLDPREARSQVDRENKEFAIVDRTALWLRAARAPFRAVLKVAPTKKVKPGKLILLRAGESSWNANQTFTGWADPDLTKRGIRESEHAARSVYISCVSLYFLKRNLF
jgi:hypothetical protein